LTLEVAPPAAKLQPDIFAGQGEIAGLLRGLDWTTSPLGPPDKWPQSLRSIVQMMLTSRYQMWMGWGPKLAYLYNDAYRPTLGVKHPLSLGRPVAEVWKEIWGDIGPLIETVLATGEAHYSEGMLLLLERSGFPEETYHTFSYSPLFDDAGSIAGLFCVVVEETERVLNERRLATIRQLASAFAGLKTEAQLFAAVSECLGANLKDLPFTLTYLLEDGGRSARLVSATGISADHAFAPATLDVETSPWPFVELQGSTPAVVSDDLASRFDAIPTGDWDRPPETALIVPLAQQTQDTVAAGFMVVGLNPYRVGDDNLRAFIGLLAGQVASALSSVRAYEEERRRAAALAEIDRAKTAFFSNVSHEFRTPLTLMLGPLEDVLEQRADAETTRAQVQLAHRNGVRLLRLVNSLLDFSRIEAGRVEATFEPTDLSQFTADIAATFRSAMDKAGLAFEIETDPMPAPAYIDRDMWEKVVLNLLSNAFKFTFEGKIAVSVASTDQHSAILTIADTGVGIPQSELPKLFERFHRVEGAKGRSFEGSGIGLALVQEMIKLHGGSISIDSVEGEGTRVSVSLPLGATHLPAERVRERDDGASAPSRAQAFVDEALQWLPTASEESVMIDRPSDTAIPAANPGEGRSVLLADDNADMRDYVGRLLRAQGYTVTAVPDGKAALASALETPPDLILSDVMMPNLDGFGLLRAVRDDQNLAGVPVVLLSARAGEEARVEGLGAGADDYLVKPFSARELLARVNANIQLAKIRREAARSVMASEQRLMMTQERLSLALSTGQVSVFEWAVDEDHLVVQGPLAEAFGVRPEDASRGMPLDAFVAGIHPGDVDRVMAALNGAVAEGAPYEAEYRLLGGPEERVVVARGDVEVGPDGRKRMAGVVIDITEEKAAETAIRESRTYLRELLNSTGEGFYAVDREGVTTLVNRAFLNLLGFASESEALGRKLHDVIHHSHPDGAHYPKEDCPIYRAARDGKPAHVDGEYFYRLDGSKMPVEYWVHPVRRDGELAGAICTFVDISERLESQERLRAQQQALEDQTQALQILNRAAAAVAGDLDLDRLVQTITDAGVELTGAQFGAFFYNVVDRAGESYMLYSLSGVPREAFSSFPMPRNTKVFAPTFAGEGVVRSADILEDPRYGHNDPHFGMPKGHLPVRSYLAVPVRSRNGEVLGGLFFGHDQPGVFDGRSEELIIGLASQASVAMDNARLFQDAQSEIAQRRKAEADLQALNSTLEDRIATALADQAKAEEALRQAQKMEAVGQLTGGVAHDFNNLLTVIIGGLDTISRCDPGETARLQRATQMALQGAQRAASLTKRLLAFSRRQPLDPKPLELNHVVRDMTEILHRTLGEQVELEGVLAPRLWTIEADQNQLESAIVNLAVNARDAMPEGGKLTIETSNTALDETYAATDSEVVPGQYVVIAVSDTGLGMSKDTLSKVFEPFFTTKEVGKGTGLGLSMVYGFVKQSGGHVTVYSEEGEGTTVKLYFPRFMGANGLEAAPKSHAAPRGRRDEVILVVEDNEDVRAYSVMILDELGYQVVQAAEAEAALSVLRSDQRIDLLFTDVVLPGKSGRVVADAAAELRPGLKVLFTTGYSRNAIVHHGRLDAGVQLISKPFTFEELATRVRDLLDRDNRK
jgi:PAS domain S-box-containing protein